MNTLISPMDYNHSMNILMCYFGTDDVDNSSDEDGHDFDLDDFNDEDGCPDELDFNED